MKEFDEWGSSQLFDPDDGHPLLGTDGADQPLELPNPPLLYAVTSPPLDHKDFNPRKPEIAMEINDANIAFFAKKLIAKKASAARIPTLALAATIKGARVFKSFFFPPRPVKIESCKKYIIKSFKAIKVDNIKKNVLIYSIPSTSTSTASWISSGTELAIARADCPICSIAGVKLSWNIFINFNKNRVNKIESL